MPQQAASNSANAGHKAKSQLELPTSNEIDTSNGYYLVLKKLEQIRLLLSRRFELYLRLEKINNQNSLAASCEVQNSLFEDFALDERLRFETDLLFTSAELDLKKFRIGSVDVDGLEFQCHSLRDIHRRVSNSTQKMIFRLEKLFSGRFFRQHKCRLLLHQHVQVHQPQRRNFCKTAFSELAGSDRSTGYALSQHDFKVSGSKLTENKELSTLTSATCVSQPPQNDDVDSGLDVSLQSSSVSPTSSSLGDSSSSSYDVTSSADSSPRDATNPTTTPAPQPLKQPRIDERDGEFEGPIPSSLTLLRVLEMVNIDKNATVTHVAVL